jgi:hypothetical protein
MTRWGQLTVTVVSNISESRLLPTLADPCYGAPQLKEGMTFSA